MKSQGFSLVFILILLSVLVIVSTGYFFFKKAGFNNISVIGHNSEIQKLGVEDRYITLYPGITKYSLPSGALLTFGRADTHSAVPDFVYGKNYNINDIHNINYVGIKNKLITYHNGYKYEIINEGCETAQRFDIDIMITEVTKCKLKYSAKKEAATKLENAVSSKKFRIVENGTPVSGLKSGKGELLLYVQANPIRLQRNVKGDIYISPGTNWDIKVITNYGIETIRYTPEELWNRLKKVGKAGEQDIEVSIDNLSCYNLTDADKDSCPYFTTIDFTISQKALEETPITILEYY